MKSKYKRKLMEKESALKKIPELIESAKKINDLNKNLSKKYIKKARNLAMKYRIKLDNYKKREICKKCNSVLIPSKTSRVRLGKKKVITTCLNCKNISRFRYKK